MKVSGSIAEGIYRIALYSLNGLYLSYIVLATVSYYLFAFPLIILTFMVFQGRRLDDAMRCSNRLYGSLLVRISWPLIRIKCEGRKNINDNLPCVIIVNHRSTADIFLSAFFTPGNTAVFVRSWPFKLWFIGWFMRRAGYIDVEKMSPNTFFKEEGRELYERGVTFLFFPEGHRSRDGRLQPFRSGAFMTAIEFNMPVVPVCMTGTEKFLSMNDPLIRPARINIDILPAVHPSSFPEERRVVKLKKHVESLVREHLHEQ